MVIFCYIDGAGSFDKWYSPIFEEGPEGIMFTDCEFINVSDVLLACENRRQGAFKNCRFVGCMNGIISKNSIVSMFTSSERRETFLYNCTFEENG